MKLLRNILLSCVFVLVGALSTSCGKAFKDKVRLNSWDVVYTTVTGPRSAEAGIRLGVENGAASFKVKDVKGDVRRGEKTIGHFTVDPGTVKVPGHKASDCEFAVRFELEEGVSMVRMMSMIATGSTDDFTFDLGCTVKYHGISRKIKYKDQPLGKYIGL